MDARSRESREATLARADGVVWSRNFLTTPPRLLHLRKLRDIFPCVAATPPPAEEGSSPETRAPARLQNSSSAIVNFVIPANVSRVFENSLERSP